MRQHTKKYKITPGVMSYLNYWVTLQTELLSSLQETTAWGGAGPRSKASPHPWNCCSQAPGLHRGSPPLWAQHKSAPCWDSQLPQHSCCLPPQGHRLWNVQWPIRKHTEGFSPVAVPLPCTSSSSIQQKFDANQTCVFLQQFHPS